ncbi:hypothetical protein [Kovacikia minuta]|nr:hypothetical protein [Kovacikia minuta]
MPYHPTPHTPHPTPHTPHPTPHTPHPISLRKPIAQLTRDR